MMDVASKRLHSQYDRVAGLASPMASTCASQCASACSSDTEDEFKKRAVQFFQCPKPSRKTLEPVPKKLRCPTPPVKQIAFSFDSGEDESDSEDEDEDDVDVSTDENDAHIDRFRRSDSDSDCSSEVFYCE